MKNDKSKNIIIGLLVVIIIILGTLVVLFATGTISLNTKLENNKNNNQENEEFNKNEQEDNKKTELTEIILPSNKSISINKEYENVFNNNEKIIVTSNGNPHIDSEAYNSELTLTEFIDKELNKYPAEFYTGKKVSVSNTLFDFDNDGINEVMFSFCEEYILLHYYNGKIYGYTLVGYRTNGSWRINGTSRFSSSAFDGGITKYSFNKEKLVSNVIAAQESDYLDTSSTDRKINYKLNDQIVTETEYNKFLKEQEKNALIEFVDYS